MVFENVCGALAAVLQVAESYHVVLCNRFGKSATMLKFQCLTAFLTLLTSLFVRGNLQYLLEYKPVAVVIRANS